MTRGIAFGRSGQGESVSAAIEKRPAVALKYLLDYIRDKGITSPDPWVDRNTFERVAESAKETGLAHPTKIVTALNGGVGYDDVRIAMACLENVV